MTKRELVLRAFRNEPVERVPVGFWFHFIENELEDAFKNPALPDRNLAGHKKFYKDFQPDFVKIMSDGFFVYPNEVFSKAKHASELRKITSIGKDNPWIEQQIQLVKNLTDTFGKEVLTFYNIFAPATIFKFARAESGENPHKILADFIAEDKAAVIHAFSIVASDIAILANRVISEGKADGVYFSAQSVNDARVTNAVHAEVITPSDTTVLEGANAAGQLNILHICGYEGCRNDLANFTSYPAQIINWAAVVEDIPLSKGKKLFGGKPVIGGFGNTVSDVLYKGSKDEIEAETARLIHDAGKIGVVLGADCTVPRNIDLQHLQWVREAAAK